MTKTQRQHRISELLEREVISTAAQLVTRLQSEDISATQATVTRDLQELGTIMQSELNVKIIILNNQFLGMVRQWQQLFNDKRYSFVNIQSPDFVQLASAYGISGQRVSDRADLKKSLANMLQHKGAYLLEVMVGKENNVFPMVPQGCSVSEIRLM